MRYLLLTSYIFFLLVIYHRGPDILSDVFDFGDKERLDWSHLQVAESRSRKIGYDMAPMLISASSDGRCSLGFQGIQDRKWIWVLVNPMDESASIKILPQEGQIVKGPKLLEIAQLKLLEHDCKLKSDAWEKLASLLE